MFVRLASCPGCLIGMEDLREACCILAPVRVRPVVGTGRKRKGGKKINRMNGNIFPAFLLCGFAAGYAFLDLSHGSCQAALSAYPFWARLGKSFCIY